MTPPCLNGGCGIDVVIDGDGIPTISVVPGDLSLECVDDALKVNLGTPACDQLLISLAADGLVAERPSAQAYIQFEGDHIQFPENSSTVTSSEINIANTRGCDLLAFVTSRWRMAYYVDTGGEFETAGVFFLNFDTVAAAPHTVELDFSIYGPSLTGAVAGSANVRVLEYHHTHIDRIGSGQTIQLRSGGKSRQGNANVHVTATGGIDDYFATFHSIALFELDTHVDATGPLATFTPV